MSDRAPAEAIILAAGVGSRLGDRTSGEPKCLVHVAGVSILERQIDCLRAVGARRLVVVTGYREERVRGAVESYASDLTIEFVHNPAYAETNVLYSWRLGSEHIHSSHYYLHADTVFELEVVRRLRDGKAAPILLTVDRHPVDAEAMKVRLHAGRIAEISKAMHPGDALGEFTGVMRVSGDGLQDLQDHADALLGRDQGRSMFVEAAVQSLLEESPSAVDWIDVTGLRWREIDFPEDLDQARRLFEEAEGG
jgi:L-glutamine-phosphate cytidylyltransferase